MILFFTSVLLVITRRDSLVVLTSALSRARLVETWNALVESSWNARGILSWNPTETYMRVCDSLVESLVERSLAK